MRYGRHKIEKFITKNLSLDDRQLADFTLGDTQQQYGGISRVFLDIALRSQARRGCMQRETLFLHFTVTLSLLEKAIKKSSHQSLRIVAEYLQA